MVLVAATDFEISSVHRLAASGTSFLKPRASTTPSCKNAHRCRCSSLVVGPTNIVQLVHPFGAWFTRTLIPLAVPPRVVGRKYFSTWKTGRYVCYANRARKAQQDRSLRFLFLFFARFERLPSDIQHGRAGLHARRADIQLLPSPCHTGLTTNPTCPPH
jgi:hypothetical protein